MMAPDDAFNGIIRTVDVALFIVDAHLTVRIYVAGSYLAVCQKLPDPFRAGNKTSLSMRSRCTVGTAKFCS